MDINNYRRKGVIETEELLNLRTVEKSDIYELLQSARELKLKSRQGERLKKLAGKNIFLMTKNSFGKARLAFEIAVRSLDAHPISLPMGGKDIEDLTHNQDSIRVLERFDISLAVVDTSDRTDALELSKHLALPVINANERAGACHSLAVLLTIWEYKNKLKDLKVVIIGGFEQDQTSLLYGMCKCGMDVTIVSPSKVANIQRAIERAREDLGEDGYVKWTSNLDEALEGCDFVYCYGHDYGEDYCLTLDKLNKLAPNAYYSQNIPFVHGKEADEELISSQKALIYDQGENLLHVERAAIYLLGK